MMMRKFLTKPATDGGRHDRFVAMMQQMGALDDMNNFEEAFRMAFKNAFEDAACSRRPAGHRRNGAGTQRRLALLMNASKEKGRCKRRPQLWANAHRTSELRRSV